MSKKKEKPKDRPSREDIREYLLALVSCLKLLSEGLAEMDQHGISEVEPGNWPTAVKGLGYAENFAKSFALQVKKDVERARSVSDSERQTQDAIREIDSIVEKHKKAKRKGV